jgi:hypothetical protein
MDYNLKIDIMKIIRLIIAGIFIVMGFLAFSQSPGNFKTLRVTDLNGNMKANGTSLVTADTVLLKSDTVRSDAELYVRDSTLLQIIQANAPQVNILNNSNNRVVTATGTANELQAEEYLNFSDTTMTVRSIIRAPDNIRELRLLGGSGTNENSGGMIRITGISKTVSPSTGAIQIRGGLGGNASINLEYATGSTISLRNYQASTQTAVFQDNLVQINPQLQLISTSNQLRFGGSTNTIITTPTPSTSRIYTIPDATENTNFIMGAGANTITNSGSTVPLTITKSVSGNALVINQTGTGSGLVVTNSGGGVAFQAGNITVDGNTIASTSGDITLTPTSDVNISSGGLEIAGTTVISSGRALSNLTGITSSGDLTLTGGKRILGINGRTIMLNKTVTLTDATATTIASITLPSGSSLNGGYVVYVDGMLVLTGNSSANSIGLKAYRGYVVWGQDSGAVSNEGFKTANTLESVSAGDQLTTRDIGAIVISGSRSGTDNRDHVIQLNVDGIGSTGGNPFFIGTISIHWYNFTTFTAN